MQFRVKTRLIKKNSQPWEGFSTYGVQILCASSVSSICWKEFEAKLIILTKGVSASWKGSWARIENLILRRPLEGTQHDLRSGV